MVGVDSVPNQDFAQYSFGGVNESMYKALGYFDAKFNEMSGNPDALGGMAPQSKTLGQDQLLYSNAGAKVGFWRRRILGHATRVLRKLAWFLWTDQDRSMELQQDLGGGLKVARMWTPEQRVGQFGSYSISATPYGIQSDTPERRYQRTVAWLTEVIIPLFPAMQAQGMAPDAAKIAEVTGDLGDIPRANEIIVMLPPAPPMGPQGQGQTSQTIRNQTTVNNGRGPARPAAQPQFSQQTAANDLAPEPLPLA